MLLFVYGTLKQGYGNHRLLNKAEFLGTTQTKDKYILLNSGFPVMMEPNPHLKFPELPVRGEVYRIDRDVHLSNLDALEGEGHMYLRKLVPLLDEPVVSTYIGHPEYWQFRRHYQVCPVVANAYEWGR